MARDNIKDSPLFEALPPRTVNPTDGPVRPDMRFTDGAIRAARNVKPEARKTIMADLADVLQCDPEALSFIFETTESETEDDLYDFPDSERRRYVLSQNRSDAAE